MLPQGAWNNTAIILSSQYSVTLLPTAWNNVICLLVDKDKDTIDKDTIWGLVAGPYGFL